MNMPLKLLDENGKNWQNFTAKWKNYLSGCRNPTDSNHGQ